MADVVNLRQKRKQMARNTREREAAENRLRFGRTKAEKQKNQLQDALEEARHKAHKIEPRRDT